VALKYKTIYLKAVIVETGIEESDVPCHSVSCTECCEKLSPFLTEDEFASGNYLYTFVNTGDDKPAIAIPRTERGCVYLNENKICTIYQRRPKSCRQFDCRKSHHPTISNKFESTI
jgi:Fe-S-cluster containining protein